MPWKCSPTRPCCLPPTQVTLTWEPEQPFQWLLQTPAGAASLLLAVTEPCELTQWRRRMWPPCVCGGLPASRGALPGTACHSEKRGEFLAPNRSPGRGLPLHRPLREPVRLLPLPGTCHPGLALCPHSPVTFPQWTSDHRSPLSPLHPLPSAPPWHPCPWVLSTEHRKWGLAPSAHRLGAGTVVEPAVPKQRSQGAPDKP